MNKKTWDLYARIPEMVKDKEVLELATGPGLLAKHSSRCEDRPYHGLFGRHDR